MDSGGFDSDLAAKAAREHAAIREFRLVDEAAISFDALLHLKGRGVNLDAKDTEGNTVLHLSAAVSLSGEKAKNLCEAGASIEPRTLACIHDNLDRHAQNSRLLSGYGEMEQLLLDHQRRREEESLRKKKEEEIQAQRRAQRVCILCGRPLPFLARLFGKASHSNCKVFTA
jgi:hypothetical protein